MRKSVEVLYSIVWNRYGLQHAAAAYILFNYFYSHLMTWSTYVYAERLHCLQFNFSCLSALPSPLPSSLLLSLSLSFFIQHLNWIRFAEFTTHCYVVVYAHTRTYMENCWSSQQKRHSGNINFLTGLCDVISSLLFEFWMNRVCVCVVLASEEKRRRRRRRVSLFATEYSQPPSSTSTWPPPPPPPLPLLWCKHSPHTWRIQLGKYEKNE